MESEDRDSDPLLSACDAVLREIANAPISHERLEAARSLIAEIVTAIRMMDEVDVRGIEPATVFRVIP